MGIRTRLATLLKVRTGLQPHRCEAIAKDFFEVESWVEKIDPDPDQVQHQETFTLASPQVEFTPHPLADARGPDVIGGGNLTPSCLLDGTVEDDSLNVDPED